MPARSARRKKRQGKGGNGPRRGGVGRGAGTGYPARVPGLTVRPAAATGTRPGGRLARLARPRPCRLALLCKQASSDRVTVRDSAPHRASRSDPGRIRLDSAIRPRQGGQQSERAGLIRGDDRPGGLAPREARSASTPGGWPSTCPPQSPSPPVRTTGSTDPQKRGRPGRGSPGTAAQGLGRVDGE